MFNFLRKRKYRDYDINPDEIFMDTINVSKLDTQQFEGVIEKPISAQNLVYLGIFFALILLLFIGKLFSLQIINGFNFLEKSENNILNQIPLFSKRGIIYDRNNKELAWNRESENDSDFLYRAYINQSGFGHILGYVNYPQKDSNENYWRNYIEGQAGLELKYNESLTGKNGSILREVNALGEKISENNVDMRIDGNNIYTTIDTDIQHYLYSAIENQAREFGFDAGAGGIMNINTGELLALTSYPEYDPYILAEGEDIEKINFFFNDKNKPFLNRAISGLYSPGSIVKPFLGLAALDAGIINESTRVLSTGKIEIPNKYNPSNSSIFKDWRPEGHGSTDIKHAIADSVNTFFYAIGGGYKNQKGLGIEKMELYLRSFGISEKTGIDFGIEVEGTIPNPDWKKKHYTDGTWRLGDTYNTAIGQFGFQVSPIQMLRGMSALANGGSLYEPILVKKENIGVPVDKNISTKNYRVIQESLRQTVTKGTAQNMNVPYVQIAAKTGTAQVGRDNQFYNSWAVGFFPYEKPKYAFVVVMEKGKRGGVGSGSRAMKTFIESIQEFYPEFWKSLDNEEQA